jgi:succinate--hydroxymethylglutarate CoA-transferase
MYSFGVLARATLRGYIRYPTSRVTTRNLQPWGRNIATKSHVSKEMVEKLPLAGIKVLDMTRVLAGVCDRPAK